MQSRKLLTGILVLIFLGTLVSILPLPNYVTHIEHASAASSIVQNTSTAISASSSYTLSLAYVSDVSAGDVLVAVFNSLPTASITSFACSDSLTNTWTNNVNKYQAISNGDHAYSNICSATTSTSGADTVTMTVTGSPVDYAGLQIYELSGVTDASVLTSTGGSATVQEDASVSSYDAYASDGVTIAGISTDSNTACVAGGSYTLVLYSTDYYSCGEYLLNSGTTTSPIYVSSENVGWAETSASFGFTGCNPASQICVTLNPVADSNSESLSASNYFTATLSNGTSFHLYSENASPFVFDSGQNITLSAQSSSSTGSTQWCWASGCPTVQIAVPSSDGSYSYMYYYYQLLGQTLSYSLAPQSPGPISAPYYDYSTAASSAGSSDSPLSVNATLSLTPLSSTYWVLNNTSPNLQTGLQSQNAGYMYLTQQNPLKVTQPNAYLNPISYVSTYIAQAPFSLVASCVYYNAGSQPNNYYSVCGTRSTSTALYDSVTANNYGTCGSTFISCTAATSTLYFGEYLMWYTWGGVNGACSNVLSAPYYVNINLTNIVSLGDNYCVGKDVGSNGGIGIYYQPSYASIGGVQIYALNFQFSKATEVSCNATVSASNVPVAVTCPAPYYTGNIYFLGLGSSAYHTTPDTLVANSNYFTNSQFLTVGSDSGQVDSQTLLFAMASQANVLPQLSSYTSPATDNMDGACGGGNGCGSSGYEIIFSQSPVYIVNFQIAGLPAGLGGSAIAVNQILYPESSFPITVPVEQGSSISYGYFADVGAYSWYSVSGCGQNLKDNVFSPTTSCIITGSYILPSQGPSGQNQVTIAIMNEVGATMIYIVPSVIILFIFMWLGISIFKLHGDVLVLMLILAVVAITAAGSFAAHSFLPAWVGGLTAVFMIVGFVYGKSRNGEGSGLEG